MGKPKDPTSKIGIARKALTEFPELRARDMQSVLRDRGYDLEIASVQTLMSVARSQLRLPVTTKENRSSEVRILQHFMSVHHFTIDKVRSLLDDLEALR